MKNKILRFALSLVIAFGLWLYMVTVISPEWEVTYYNVPVGMTGNEYLNANNLIIVSSPELKMNLTLRGNRTDLNKLSSSNITILADLTTITSAGDHQLKYTISYPGSIQSGKVEVVNREPQEITVTVAQQLSKTFAVEVYYVGNPASGYEADRSSISMDHTTVTVRGPKDLVEKIDHAGITIDLTGKTSTFVWDYQLIFYTADSRPVLDNSLTTNVDEVRTIIQVNRVKKVPLAFEIDDTDSGMLKDMVVVHPSLEEITVRGNDLSLEHLTEIRLDPIVLSTLTGDTSLTYHLNLPAGVTCKEGEDIVHLDITLPKMVTKEFTVTNFEPANVPEGMSVEVTGEQLVSIRGPEEQLSSLDANAILGKVDCSGVTAESTFAPISYTAPGYEYMIIHADLGVVTIHVVENQE